MTSSVTSLNRSKAHGSGSLWMMTQYLPVTTFIGAGGKTTCLRSLTQEIKSAGLQVVASTTTKVYPEESMVAWRSINPPPRQKGAFFWYDKRDTESGKWIGPNVAAVDAAIADDILSPPDLPAGTDDRQERRFWVIEGDGARERKLKCWESYEPQIPGLTDCAVLVVDRGLWGKVLQGDQVHRAHRCPDLLGKVWTAESAWSYFLRSPVFAPSYVQMSWVVLLNSPSPVKTIENNIENKIKSRELIDPLNSLDLLQALWERWLEIYQKQPIPVETKPKHLRLAAGDAKEGDLTWFDLW